MDDQNHSEPLLYRIAPGLPALVNYRWSEDFRYDLVAGLSVAAVALPVAIAYAQLAGFEPVVGLYSCILPMVAYAVFGTSRQLMVSADAATCAMIAATVAPLAAGNYAHYWSLSVTLAFLSGVFCILASFFRLGALADFLSKPILVGYLNGIAISIFLGQVGKLCGFNIQSKGIIQQLIEIAHKLPDTQPWTFAVGVGTFAILILTRRLLPRLPEALIGMILASIVVAVLGLSAKGVEILGTVPAGLPPLRLPEFPLEYLPPLTLHAAGLSLVLFSSGMLTARSFASKNHYDIDVDREFLAFGAANIASALSQGFAVTGADSRTAMANATGNRTQVTGLVAALAIAAVLLFFTHPLQYAPISALGAVLVFASFSLIDVKTLRSIWHIDKTEVVLSIITTLGVVAFGAIDAILVAVILALARFIKFVARPADEILGKVEGMHGLHSIGRHPSAQTFPGLILYRFNSPITFFNAAYFKQRVLHQAKSSESALKWFVIDAIPISEMDVTGLYALRDLKAELDTKGILLILAGRQTEYREWLRKSGLYRTEEYEHLFFPTLHEALRAYQSETQKAVSPPEEE